MSTLPLPALAWGPEGHKIVALIAEKHLSPIAREEIVAILHSADPDALAGISTWADEWRRDHPETAPWHFVDIPLSGHYDADRDCRGGNCVVTKISEFSRILADRNAPLADRQQALRYVVHFVGDIMQPLHSADRDDHGGNGYQVTFYGRTTNLHRLWDSEILEKGDGHSPESVADQLNARITTAQVTEWSRGSPADWANQAHDVAVSAVYGPLENNSHIISTTYAQTSVNIVNIQLMTSGVRLAGVLNTVFQ